VTTLDGRRRTLADDVFAAADVLSAFTEQAAAQTAGEMDFGYGLAPDAANTFPVLAEAYARSVATGAPLPISSASGDDVIYTSPNTNGALRFWHDVNHVRRHLEFGLVDELELSLSHLGEPEEAGYLPGSLVWRLLHADLPGQAYVQAFGRRFPRDQRRFVTGCLTAGFDHGLLAELRSTGVK
jgi:hypothetical protein